jgi:putative tricarboxylic transport membrane protein
MIENLSIGFDVVFTTHNLFFIFLGCLLGTLVGIIPGIGPTASISIILPITFSLEPVTGIMMLAGIYYGSQYGGSTTAILLNTPGENSSVMTCIDGNQMAKQGRPGIAIAAAAIGSFIAGILMVIAVAFLSPLLSEVAFKFGPAEFALLMLFGLVSVIVFTDQDLLKGIVISLIGVSIGMIGADINSGINRFTFDIPELIDKIGFVIVAVGLFAVPEIIKNLQNPDSITRFLSNFKIIPSKQDFQRIIPASLRGTFIGGLLGLIPGGGITTASYAAYAFDKKISVNKDQFGKGAIEGVAAPEAANNAAAQAGFIPLLSLGIPENAVMALILSSLMMFGITPGPLMIESQPELFWGLVVSMLVGNFILLILNFPLIRIWVQVLRVPYHMLYPMILFACCLGIFATNTNMYELYILAGVSIFGYILYIFDLSPITFILGFVLGSMFEENFRRALTISQGDFTIFYSSSVSIIILFLISLMIIFQIFKKRSL